MSTSDGSPPADACASCGTLAVGDARFCRRCGDPLPASPPPPPTLPMGAGAPSSADELTTATMTADPRGASDGDRSASAPDGADQGELPALADPPASAPAAATTQVPRFMPSPRREPDAVSCPACAVSNRRDRELCVACGVDLETGTPLPQPRPSHGAGATAEVLLPSAAHRVWWVAPLAIVGVAAAILTGLWVAELGPFATEPELPPARFASERYPVDDDPVALLLSDVATVTTRPPEGARTFPVEQMVDTDPETAWHSHPRDLPQGVDEKVDLFLEEPAWVAQVVINNGDHADPSAYEAAGRLQRAALVADGGVRMDIVLLDLGREPQAVSLPEPVLTTTVRLEILDVIPGAESDGLAISDLELRGWSADQPDADLAVRRADVRQAAGSFTVPG